MKKLLLLLVIFITQNLNSQNENFEDGSLTTATPGTITVVTSNAINGWTVNGGSNSSWGASGNCTNTSPITGNPNACVIISPGSAGHVDAIIGAAYPIFSVYGSTAVNYPFASAINGFNCYGDWFLKLNNQTPGASVNRISKTIPVTPANALFQFATMSVIEGSHCCCDNPGYSIRLKISTGCFGAPTLTTCPSFSASPPAGPGCTPTGTCGSPGNPVTFSTSVVNSNWKYSKWKLNTIDLSSFIGDCVTIELTSFDCPYSAHAGYTYFDAQSSPLEVIVNGNSFPAGPPMINVSHCGSGSTATITAPSVTGGYTWTCPGPYTIAPASGTITAGQQIYTSTTGNHTVTMNPPGSCSPFVRIINLMLSPAPNMAIPSTTQTSCVSFMNGVSIIMSSGTPNAAATPNYYVTFSPAPPSNTIGVSANSGTYTGLASGVNTITITDSIGCTVTQTININGMPAIPSLMINAPNGTVIGCVPNYVPLNAVNTSTDPLAANMTFTWTGPSTFSVSPNLNPTAPGSYTVMGQATYTTSSGSFLSCIAMSFITISGSTVIPACNVSPLSRTLTCNGACAQFTATSTGTTNIIGTWYNSSGPVNPPSNPPLIACFNAPGTYTAQFCSTISGCCNTQTIAVVSNTAIPTITITPTSFNGFTINCTNPNVVMNVNTSSTVAPMSYTWIPLSNPSASTTPAAGGFTATIPGQYEALFKDGYACTISQTIAIVIDTLRPTPVSLTDMPSNSYTINCFKPCLISTAITNPLLPPTSYSWTTPGPLTLPSNTIQVCLADVTSSTTPTNYTVSAMGPNGCIGKAKVLFYKDVYAPLYNIAYTPSVITCANPCVAMSPTGTTTTPITYTFTSPPPTQTATTSGALMCTPGIYTMTYQNMLNGCIRTASTTVLQNVVPPAVNPQPIVYLLCGATSTIISAGTVTTSSTYSYSWDGPSGAGMSCLSGTACSTPSINAPGIYNVYILNMSNGCSSINSVTVVAASSLPVSISGNTTMCVGEINVLSASGATSYTWSTGSNANSIGVSPTVTTTYTLTGEITASTTCTGQTTITIVVDPCVGIKELEWSKNISIAPNPNSGKFNVVINSKIENAEIRIVNTVGQEVFKQIIKQGNNEINTGVLAKGIYHYSINQNKEPVNRGKIIIE